MIGTVPNWIKAVCITNGVSLLILGTLSWLAPQLLFGAEGYRTVARGIIGLLGSLCLGLSLSLLWVSTRKQLLEVAGTLRVLVIGYFGIPAVLLFNFGAVEPIRETSGVNVFVLLGISTLVLLLPATLALLVALKLGTTNP